MHLLHFDFSNLICGTPPKTSRNLFLSRQTFFGSLKLIELNFDLTPIYLRAMYKSESLQNDEKRGRSISG